MSNSKSNSTTNSTTKTGILGFGVLRNWGFKRFGFVQTDGGRDVYIDDRNGPLSIIAGVKSPEFSQNFLDLPTIGVRIVLLVADDGKMDSERPTVLGWGYEHQFNRVQQEIMNRKKYRITRSIVGEASGTSAPKVVFVGTAEEFEVIMKEKGWQRDGWKVSVKDQFAPTLLRPKGVSYIHKFECSGNDDIWKPCSDFRPFPVEDIVYQVIERKNGKQSNVRKGTATALQFYHPFGAPNDRLSAGSIEQGFRFHEKSVKGGPFAACSDPRQALAEHQKETIEKYLEKNKAKQVVTSLADLPAELFANVPDTTAVQPVTSPTATAPVEPTVIA